MQAKLLAKNKRLRENQKSALENQLGVFNPEEASAQDVMASQEILSMDEESKAALQQHKSAESIVSLPNEAKVKEELKKLDESEQEDAEYVEKIEGAQTKLIQAERQDNTALKRRVSVLQDELVRTSQQPSVGGGAANISVDQPSVEQIAAADVEELKRMIAECQATIAQRDARVSELEQEKAAISENFEKQLGAVRDEFASMSQIAV